MVVQRLFDFELDRVSRDNFSDESGISSFPYISDYFAEKEFCEYNRPQGSEWAAILSFIFVVLGVSTSTAYLIVTFRHSSALTSNFPFLNNFLLASFINLLSNGIFDIHVIKNGCWYGGRLLCKVLPTISDTSENAMVLFMVAIILEQNHPYVRSFLSKKTKFRKRLTITVLWLITVVFSIPEVIIWDIVEFYESQFCTLRLPRYHHYGMYAQKGLFLEYVVPLLLLIVTLAHAAAVSRKGSSTRPTTNQALDESNLRNDDNERHEETNNQCPPIRVTSVVIGAVLFVTKTPFYLSHFLFAFFDVRSIFLSGFSFVLYPVSSIFTPVVVMFSSPFHKKRLKETYQFIAAYMAGRRVKKGFLLREEDEEKL